MHICIVGCGISGLAGALALTKFVKPVPEITIIETRNGPGTIGGAINLTPKCQRYLQHLGVHQKIVIHGYGADVRTFQFLDDDANLLSSLDCSNGGKGFGDPPFNCMRILRSDMVQCMVDTVAEQSNVKVRYGVQLMKLEDDESSLTLTLSDESSLTLTLSDESTLQADLLLGCDGVHSMTRTNFVEPERTPTYTGCAAAIGFADVRPEERETLPFQDICIVMGRYGRFFCSYYNAARDSVFLGAQLGDQKESLSRNGWTAKGADQAGVKKMITDKLPRRVSGVHQGVC